MADSITFAIADMADFKSGFLKARPVPVDEDTEEPEFTDDDWIRECGKKMYLTAYRKGKAKIAEETTEPTIDENIIS